MDIGREMALPMESMIGGPLQALVKAQVMAARETASFIQSAGLEEGKARTVDFSFDRTVVGEGGAAGKETVSMNVPLLTIVPMPFIRVEEATIDFECNVSSSTVDTSSQKLGVSGSLEASAWGAKLSLKANFSQQKTSKSEVDKSASLKVHVKAVQDELPGGLRKLLDIMETAVTDNVETA